MTEIAHEAPNSIFRVVQELTDFDYCLVHLLSENEEYRDNFLLCKSQGRRVMLDNSIFELGEAFDTKKYVKWIKKLKPEWYIVPDVLEESKATIDSYLKFVQDYPDLPGKRIGVLQGKSYHDLITCYKVFQLAGVERIAISFNLDYYNEIAGPGLEGWMKGRQMFLDMLCSETFFLTPLHLLGCSLPQEFTYYNQHHNIHSIDTSNPVVHGLCEKNYSTEDTLEEKVSTKLFTLIESDVTDKQLTSIFHNIKAFKRNVSKNQL